MLQEIREREYAGGYGMVTAYLFPLKQQPVEPVVCFETGPCEQMQVDFTIIRQGVNTLLAKVATPRYLLFDNGKDIILERDAYVVTSIHATFTEIM